MNKLATTFILSLTLVGCDDRPRQRDIYTSLEDCLSEWEFTNLCEFTTVTDSNNRTSNYYLSPYYEPNNRGVVHATGDDDDPVVYFYPVHNGAALYSPMVNSTSPLYLRPSGTASVLNSIRPTSTPKSSVNSANIMRGGFGSNGSRAMSFGG